MATTHTTPVSADAFAERLFSAVLGAQEVQAVYLGQRLGWYAALADAGPMTAAELAEHTGSAERYAREWLEHQAVCGYLEVDDATAAAEDRRFSIAAGPAEVLTDHDSLLYVAPVAQLVAAVGRQIDAIGDAYRTGGGVSWATFGKEVREAQAAANRPLFLHQLGAELLPQVADLDARLRAGGRVADVGTGAGWSAIGIARSYPHVAVDGFDLDAPSIDLARANAETADVADRVAFHVADAGSAVAGSYDVVFAFECIHDLADPVAVLTTMRRLAGSDGIVVVMDENVAEEFTAPGDDVERLMYGYSLTCCLPDGLSHQPSAGTGTVMRPDTLRGYAKDAGFSNVEILPISHDFFRFYRLEQEA